MSNNNPHWGSTLDDFLPEEGLSGAAEAGMRLEALRTEIRKGIESGEPTAWDPEEIKALGRKRLAAERKGKNA